MIKIKKMLALLLAAFFIFSLAACSKGGNAPTVAVESEQPVKSENSESVNEGMPKSSGDTLVVGTMAWPLGLPVKVAEENGYYDEVGLDVDIEIFATGGPVNEAMAAGELDVAVSGTASVYALATGMYTYVGDGLMTVDGEAIYARSDSEIAKQAANEKGVIGSAETVKGAEILGPLSTTSHFQAIMYAQEFGLTEEDFSMVSMDYAQAYQAFITGEGDLIATKSPESHMLEADGYVKICDITQVLGAPVVDAIYVQGEVAENRRNDVELFLYCYYKACEDLMNDETARREIAMRWYAEEGIEYTEDEMDAEVLARKYNTISTVDADTPMGTYMRQIGGFYCDKGMIEKENMTNIENSIDTSFFSNMKKWYH